MHIEFHLMEITAWKIKPSEKKWLWHDHFCTVWHVPGVLSTNINFNLCKERFCKLCVTLMLCILHGAFPQRNCFYLYFLPHLQFISDWHTDKSIQFLYIIVQPLIISTYFSSIVFLFRINTVPIVCTDGLNIYSGSRGSTCSIY